MLEKTALLFFYFGLYVGKKSNPEESRQVVHLYSKLFKLHLY